MPYAKNTRVDAGRTVSQIRTLIERFGASDFGFVAGSARATVAFRYQGRTVRFDLELPSRSEFAETPVRGRARSPAAAHRSWQRACDAKWRSLLLLIKALFVAIEDGLLDFDRAFMHDIVMPDGRTVGQRLLADVQSAVTNNQNVPLLLEA